MSSKEKRKSVSIIRSSRPKTSRSSTQKPEFSKVSKEKIKRRKSGSFQNVPKQDKLKKKSLTSRGKKKRNSEEFSTERISNKRKSLVRDTSEVEIGSLRKKDRHAIVEIKRHWFAESDDVNKLKMDSDRLIIQNALRLLGVDSDFQREVIDIIESRARVSGDPPKKLDRVLLLEDIVLVCQREIDDIHRTEVPVARIQSYFRTFHVLQCSATEVSVDKLAYFDRFLASEQKFVIYMTALKNDYYLPLKSDLLKNLLPGITFETVQRIFFNFEKLLDTSNKVVSKMTQMKEYSPYIFGFGQLFLSIMPSLIDYVAYMSNLQLALESLNKAFLDPYFKSWVTRRKAESELQLFYLSDLLSLPAVQIAKYEEVVEGIFTASIKNYKKKLKKKITVTVSSLEYDEIYNLKAAREEILQKKALIEESLNLNLSEIQESLIDLDFDLTDDNYRRFLRDGSLIWKKTALDYHLFNDLIILSKNRRVKEYLYLDTLEMVKGNPDMSERQITFEVKKKYLKNLDVKFKKIVISLNQDDADFYNLLKTYIDASRLLNKVFGVNLTTLSKRPDTEDDIPFVLVDIVQYLSDPSRIISTGIFRKSGNLNIIDSTKEKLNNGISISHLEDDDDNIDVAASLLKLFLRELPEPVIPFDLYEPLMAISLEIKEYKLFKETVKILKEMPSVNLKVLTFLLRFLKKVAKYSDENLMTIDNLSLIISGNIIRPRIETPETTLNYGRSNEIFEKLITNYKDFAKSFEIKPVEKNENVSYIVSTSEFDEPLMIYHRSKEHGRTIGGESDIFNRNQIKQDVLKGLDLDDSSESSIEESKETDTESPKILPKKKDQSSDEKNDAKESPKKATLERRRTAQNPKSRRKRTRLGSLEEKQIKALRDTATTDAPKAIDPLAALRTVSGKKKSDFKPKMIIRDGTESLYILNTLKSRRKNAKLIETSN